MPPSNFNVDEFFRNTAHYASQGRGRFTLLVPPLVLDAVTPNNRAGADLSAKEKTTIDIAFPLLQRGLLAKTIADPGINLGTFEEFSFSGPTRKHAHSQIFGTLNVEFLLMGATLPHVRAIYDYFDLWMTRMVQPQFAPGTLDKIPTEDGQPFALEYYDNYTTQAQLEIFSPSYQLESTPVLTIQYFGLYPQALQGFSTSWDNQDAPITLSVTFELWYRKTIN